MTRWTLAAAALAVVVTAIVHTVFADYHIEVFALFLALTSCVYGGSALAPEAGAHGRLEALAVTTVFACAVAGLLVSPLWLAAGYLAHGVWDWLHHSDVITTPVRSWFPPACAVFDVVVAIGIVTLVVID